MTLFLCSILISVGDFSATDAMWSPDGNTLAIVDRVNTQFCVLYDDATEPEQSISRRWNGDEGLTHVSEGDEEDDRSVLLSLQEAEAIWTRRLSNRPGLVGGA